MTKTTTAAPFPHEDSSQERLMKGMIRSDTNVANEIARQRRQNSKGFKETQAIVHQSKLEVIQSNQHLYEQVRLDLNQVSLDLCKLTKVLKLWNEVEDSDQEY